MSGITVESLSSIRSTTLQHRLTCAQPSELCPQAVSVLWINSIHRSSTQHSTVIQSGFSTGLIVLADALFGDRASSLMRPQACSTVV